MTNLEVSTRLIQLIKQAQPTTSFSGNIIRYGESVFTLPNNPPEQANNISNTFR
jgi:hypothetical protein